MQWRRAGRWLLRACAAYKPEVLGAEQEDDDGIKEHDGDCELRIWEMDCPDECGECGAARGGERVAGHNGMQRRRSDSGPHEQGRRLAVACGPVAQGRNVAVLYGMGPVGLWPLARSVGGPDLDSWTVHGATLGGILRDARNGVDGGHFLLP